MTNSATEPRQSATTSIKTKLLVAVGVCAFLGLTAGTIVDYLLERNRTDERLEERYALVLDLFATQLIAPAQFRDADRLEATVIKLIEKDPQFVAIDVRDTSGSLLYSYDTDGTRNTAIQSALNTVEANAVATKQTSTLLEADIYAGNIAIKAPGARGDVGQLSYAIDVSKVHAETLFDVLMAMTRTAVASLLAIALIVSQLKRLISRPIQNLNEVVDEITEQNFDTVVKHTERNDEIGSIARGLETLKERLAKEAQSRAARAVENAQEKTVFDRLAQGLSEIANGRVGRTIDPSDAAGLKPEYTQICNDFNAVQENLHGVLSTASQTAEAVRSSAQEISESIVDQSKRSEAQAVTLEESAAAIETLSTSVEQTAENASNASTLIGHNRAQAQSGGEVVAQTVAAMRNIEESSEQITAIIGVIDDIAFQTNLLALNAGVEAARAGEAGRGFAVVASEVRALAQRASDSANEIKELIHRSGEQVTQGSALVNRAGAALEEIITGVNKASEVVSQIATGSRDQANNLVEIKESVTELDRVTQRNAAMIEEASAATRSLSSETNRMAEVLQAFNLSPSDQKAPRPANAVSETTPKPKNTSEQAPAAKSAKPVSKQASNGDEALAEEWDEDAARDKKSVKTKRKLATRPQKAQKAKPAAAKPDTPTDTAASPETTSVVAFKSQAASTEASPPKAAVVSQSDADFTSEGWEDF